MACSATAVTNSIRSMNGLSANWPRNSSTSRDLLMPGSLTIRTNCPAPAKRVQSSEPGLQRSSSRPTKRVIATAPSAAYPHDAMCYWRRSSLELITPLSSTMNSPATCRWTVEVTSTVL